MNVAVAKPEAAKPVGTSLINVMAAKYNMDPKAYADAVKKTAMPSNATTEEFAAFMMVAKEYNLNPLLKEIHAFPKKGGGIVPVVSIDGWVSLVNQHPAINGFEFEMHYTDKAELVACTCRMYRKDRTHPVSVTEYLSECYRNTEPWKMKHRMLRHKAMIQAARYCFGFSGVYDEDEAERISQMRDITPPPAERPRIENFVNPKTGEVIEQRTQEQPAETVTEEQSSAQAEAHAPFGHADAHALGERYFDEKRPLSPPSDLAEEYHDAFKAGWEAREAEVAAEKKAKKS